MALQPLDELNHKPTTGCRGQCFDNFIHENKTPKFKIQLIIDLENFSNGFLFLIHPNLNVK